MLRKLIREDMEKRSDMHHNSDTNMMEYGGAYGGIY